MTLSDHKLNVTSHTKSLQLPRYIRLCNKVKKDVVTDRYCIARVFSLLHGWALTTWLDHHNSLAAWSPHLLDKCQMADRHPSKCKSTTGYRALESYRGSFQNLHPTLLTFHLTTCLILSKRHYDAHFLIQIVVWRSRWIAVVRCKVFEGSHYKFSMQGTARYLASKVSIPACRMI